jgi:crotonobetainyl-CoA:carnitine CoA-transferase CaiB-like acyl-CoA transferase
VRAGGVNRPPIWNRTFMADYGGAQLGAVALVAALLNRARRGHGAELNVPLFNAGIFLQSELVQRRDGTFEGAQLLNSSQTGYRPAESLYECSDGWIAVVIRDEASAARFLTLLGLATKMSTQWSTWSDSDGATIGDAIKPWPSDELLAALKSGGVWAAKCRKDAERSVFADQALKELGTIQQIPHPRYGHIRQISPLARFSLSCGAVPASSPSLGEHTTQIMRELGYETSEIESAYAENVVR